MNFKGELSEAMTSLARDSLVRFIGYGVTIGKAGGTLSGVPESMLIEMPVAENLMAGFAIGLALKGLKPVVFFERFDFVPNAMDAIVNHLDKIKSISSGEFNPAVILRIVVGNRQNPLFTGATHTQDLSPMLRAAVSFPVINLLNPATVQAEYAKAHHALPDRSTALIEYKDQ